MVPAEARVALDLGAGTGKFTRSLAERDLDVVAVEPLPEMRAVLETALPAVRALIGSGEQIPIQDASVDLVTVAQAWHWMDVERTTREIARVLRPGGSLALVWNRRNESVPWVACLGKAMEGGQTKMIEMEDVAIGPPFGTMETFVCEWSSEVDLVRLLGLAESRSYFITATAEKQAEVRARIRSLVEDEPAISGRKTFLLPYRTYCFRARLPA